MVVSVNLAVVIMAPGMEISLRPRSNGCTCPEAAIAGLIAVEGELAGTGRAFRRPAPVKSLLFDYLVGAGRDGLPESKTLTP